MVAKGCLGQEWGPAVTKKNTGWGKGEGVAESKKTTSGPLRILTRLASGGHYVISLIDLHAVSLERI